MSAELQAQVERLREALKWAVLDKENAQADVTAKNREIGSLKAELTKQRQSSPEAKGVQEVFDHWVHALGKDPSRTKPDSKLGEKRQAKIRARLRESFTVDELKRAIDGLAAMPYVTAKGRAETGSHSQLYDDLTIALADETTVPRFIAYLDTPSNVTPLPARSVALADDPFRRPLDRAVLALRREFGDDAVFGDFDHDKFHADCWWSVCPVKPDAGHPTRLRERGGIPGGSLVLDCVHGCLPSQLADAIRQLEAKRTAARVEAA